MHVVYLSLGTNLGDKEHNLKSAIREISKRIGSVTAQSDFIETEPWGFSSDNTFLNAAVKVETMLSPFELLSITQKIERELGRKKKSTPAAISTDGEGKPLPVYHDRPIDIDILLYYTNGTESLALSTPTLTIPHPLMNERDFVQIPLKQIL